MQPGNSGQAEQTAPRTKKNSSALGEHSLEGRRGGLLQAGLVLGTFFGAGFSPLAPGTVASAITVALLAAAWPAAISPLWLLLGAAALFLPGVGAASACEQYFRRRDPGPVVFDEVVGQMIALAAVPRGQLAASGWKYWLPSFILFRLLDIFKPFPVDKSERLPGGWGIMADDCVAGGYAFIAVGLAAWWGG